MGVPRFHCEKILQNVNNLRQTMFGHLQRRSEPNLHHFNKHASTLNPAAWALKTVAMNANYRGMNPYAEEYSGYSPGGSSMQGMGYHQGSYENASMAMMGSMGGGGSSGYPGYEANQSHMMMAGQSQMSAMYQQQTQQAYLAQQQQQQQQQYYANSSGSPGGQYNSQAYAMQSMGGNSQFYNAGNGSQGQQGGAGNKMVPPPHHHIRNTTGQQNPQQVADNILQMASAYPSHHTVQVPLKNRHAPYQIPRSPQNFYPEKGNSQQGMVGSGGQQGMVGSGGQQGMVGGMGQQQQTMSSPQHSLGGQQAMCQLPAQTSQSQVGQVMYAGSSPHGQMPPSSSPLLSSPHPHQSPSNIHSPCSAPVCSPVPSSPGVGNMRSPCSVPMRSPAHLSSGYPGQVGGQVGSPSHKAYELACPSSAMHSPASHGSSPYTPSNMGQYVGSPPQSSVYSGPAHSPYKMDMLMDSGQGPGGQGPGRQQGSDPLQSLQKLVMLPETQVVDPKSVVSEGCLQTCDEGSKNCEGPAEQSEEAAACSAKGSITDTTPSSLPLHTPPSVTNTTPPSLPIHTPPSVTNTTPPSTSVNGPTPPSVTDSTAPSLTHYIPLSASLNGPTPPSSEESSQSSSVEKTTAEASSEKHNIVSIQQNTDASSGAVASSLSKSSSESESVENAGPSLSTLPQTQSFLSVKSDEETSLTQSSQKSADNVDKNVELKSPPPEKTSISPVSKVSAQTSSQGSSEEVRKTSECTPELHSAPKKHQNGIVASPLSKVDSKALSVQTDCTSDSKDISAAGQTQVNSSETLETCSPKSSKDTTKTPPKPSPPKTRHSERLAHSSNPKLNTKANSSKTQQNSPCKSDAEKDPSDCSVQTSEAGSIVGSADFVNGHTPEPHMNGTNHCDATKTKNHHGKRNNVQSKAATRHAAGVESKVGKKRKRRAHGVGRVTAVNGPAEGGLLVCSTHDNSDSESELHSQLLGVKSSNTDAPFQPVGNIQTGSDNEEDRFASGLDFGCDSPPPCDPPGDEGCKREEGEKALPLNGVDEADGNCSEGNCDKGGEGNCDKGEDITSKGSKDSNPTKPTPSLPTRVVTRSSTGRAPKRKMDDAYLIPAKRTRRGSGPSSKPAEPLSLSMECEEIETKDSFSEVEVISSGDENSPTTTHPNKATESKRLNRRKQHFDEQSWRKSPVVVLTKPVPPCTKAEQGATNSQRPAAVSPKQSRSLSSQQHSMRGQKGRYVSKNETGSNSASSSAVVKVDSDSDDEPLILVQRRSSREEETQVKTETSPKVKSEVSNSKRLVSSETNTVGSADFSFANFSVLAQSRPMPEVKASTSRTVSPARSDSSSPRKRGRPKKEEETLDAPPKDSKGKQGSSKVKKKKKKSFSKPDCADDSFKDMKFSQTLNHLKSKKKGESSQAGGPFSPFVRVTGKRDFPRKVSVFNQPPVDTKDPKASSKKKNAPPASPPTVTVQITNFSSDKTVMLPSSKTSESAWVCALCGKRSSYRFLGDLFGPYYLESHLPSSSSKKDSTASSNEAQSAHNTRRKSIGLRRASSVEEGGASVPSEVWVHEDCAMWSSGVYLVDSRLYGLEEALRAAMATVCACCKEKGAMMGCLHKGCNQNFHYMCAVDKTCFLDVENFSMLCPKHKDKRMKTASGSATKS